MRKLDVAYECEYCKKLFKTDRHRCKFNPTLKNCFTCFNFDGWDEYEYDNGVYIETLFYPICEHYSDSYDLEIIKRMNYNMQCDKWKKR